MGSKKKRTLKNDYNLRSSISSSVNFETQEFEDQFHKPIPACAHGPTLLYEQVFFDSKIKKGTKKQFFACSAFSDPEECGFHLSFEKWKSGSSLTPRTSKHLDLLKTYRHKKKQRNQLNSSQPIYYCQTCQVFLNCQSDHANHTLSLISDLSNISLFDTLSPQVR